MDRTPGSRDRGFTLVEILLVVIILGILAGIVLPQFTNATNDSVNSSIASTLQTARNQVELFKMQHSDTPPAALWTVMLSKSTTTESGPAAGSGTDFGPYILKAPVNPANGLSVVGTAASTTVGWVYVVSGNVYTLSAVDTTGDAVLTY